MVAILVVKRVVRLAASMVDSKAAMKDSELVD
jgi:hypothetical protein